MLDAKTKQFVLHLGATAMVGQIETLFKEQAGENVGIRKPGDERDDTYENICNLTSVLVSQGVITIEELQAHAEVIFNLTSPEEKEFLMLSIQLDVERVKRIIAELVSHQIERLAHFNQEKTLGALAAHANQPDTIEHFKMGCKLLKAAKAKQS